MSEVFHCGGSPQIEFYLLLFLCVFWDRHSCSRLFNFNRFPVNFICFHRIDQQIHTHTKHQTLKLNLSNHCLCVVVSLSIQSRPIDKWFISFICALVGLRWWFRAFSMPICPELELIFITLSRFCSFYFFSFFYAFVSFLFILFSAICNSYDVSPTSAKVRHGRRGWVQRFASGWMVEIVEKLLRKWFDNSRRNCIWLIS